MDMERCRIMPSSTYILFFFNDTATTEIYSLPLHDALPISVPPFLIRANSTIRKSSRSAANTWNCVTDRSEEHTSELQSQSNLVCRLLLEKKKPDAYHGTMR